jgi:hypothetical protein
VTFETAIISSLASIAATAVVATLALILAINSSKRKSMHLASILIKFKGANLSALEVVWDNGCARAHTHYSVLYFINRSNILGKPRDSIGLRFNALSETALRLFTTEPGHHVNKTDARISNFVTVHSGLYNLAAHNIKTVRIDVSTKLPWYLTIMLGVPKILLQPAKLLRSRV